MRTEIELTIGDDEKERVVWVSGDVHVAERARTTGRQHGECEPGSPAYVTGFKAWEADGTPTTLTRQEQEHAEAALIAST
jgi:hypothetical protein